MKLFLRGEKRLLFQGSHKEAFCSCLVRTPRRRNLRLSLADGSGAAVVLIEHGSRRRHRLLRQYRTMAEAAQRRGGEEVRDLEISR